MELMVEETTRRLPSWMMPGGAAAAFAAATATADPVKQKKKKKKKKDDDPEEEEEDEEEKENSNSLRSSRFSLRKCQSKRITSSSNKEIPPLFTENEDSVPNNKKLNRKRKPKVAAVPECRNDDSVLTVEDLVSIAEEYIQGNELSKHEHSTNKEHELRIDLPTADSAVNPCQLSLIAHEKKDRSSSGEKQRFVSFSRSGDPAQDMLDLLLGPLLNKLPDEEKKHEFILENIAFSHNLENQSRNGIGEQIVPPAKKKASLKSKMRKIIQHRDNTFQQFINNRSCNKTCSYPFY